MAAQIVCFGEMLLRLSAPGRELLLQTPTLSTYFGGAEANVAASLATFGHRAQMVSTLPENAIGRACVSELRRLGVETSAMRFCAGRMGIYFLSTGALHRPSEVLYDRAGSAFSLAAAESYDWPAILAGADWLHLSGITPAVSASAGQAALAAVGMARELGVRVSFDCNFRQKLWAGRLLEAPDILLRLASNADLLFGNDRDIALMLSRTFTQQLPQERFRAAGAAAFAAWPNLEYLAATERSHVSVDHQELSGLLLTRDSCYTTRSWTLNGIVDRIGGGDAFAAGLLHAIIRGMGDSAGLEFAVAASCLKHSVPGDANLVSESDVLALLADSSMDVRR